MMHGISGIQETSLATERLGAYLDHFHNSNRSITICDKMRMNIKSVIFACALVLTIFGVYFVTVYSGRQRQYDQLSDPDQQWLQAIMKEMKQMDAEKTPEYQIPKGGNVFGRYGNVADKYRGEDRTQNIFGRRGDLGIEWPKRDDIFASVDNSEEKDESSNNDLQGEYSDSDEKLKQAEYSEGSDNAKRYGYSREEQAAQKDSTEYEDDMQYKDIENHEDNNFLKSADNSLNKFNAKYADEHFTVSNKEYQNIIVNKKIDTDQPTQNAQPTGYFSSTEIDTSERQRQPIMKDSRIRIGYESNVDGERRQKNKWFTAIAPSTVLKTITEPSKNDIPYSSTPFKQNIESNLQNKVEDKNVPNRVINETFWAEKVTEPLNPEEKRKSDPGYHVFTPNIQNGEVESVYDKLKKDFEYHAALLQAKKTNANTNIDSHKENADKYNMGTVQENDSKALHLFDWYTPGVDPSVSDCTIFQTISGVLNICVYPEDQDSAMSTTLQRRHTWEFEILRDVQLALLKNNTYNLIDLGSSLGMYSLAAASLNRKVIAVEPFIAHVRRFQKSVMLNKFQSIITLLVNAISDQYEFVQSEHPEGDMTASRVTSLDGDHFLQKDIDQMRIVNTITMNDLLNVVDFKSAILKMDIAGDEYKAMKHADKLFQAINIPFIFMHWTNIQNIVHAGDIIAFLVVTGYEPRAGLDGKLLDIKKFQNWAGDVVWHLKSSS
ncbi:hypothetical protein CHS0354_022454 [Potamilus streckersoni]|uniref:Methyltransferase FkbM domain-containing protein n=1 Tax=Potamilus streckersoni TaxID=2493646 RepID=A0AAE0W391_9BIVA|nr:hypothetical protein CHS0354_022454 [Potamilus streckersoni]